MDVDFAVICPLVQRLRLRSGSCSSARASDPRFLQTPPRGDALALHCPSPPSGWEEDLHLHRCWTCSAYKRKGPRSLGGLSVVSWNGYFIGVFAGSGAGVVDVLGAGAASADFGGCFVNTQNCTS